jgi:hypothetical protein
MNLIRNRFTQILLFVAFTYLGALLIQQLGIGLNGRDALCYSGLLAGVLIFAPLAKTHGFSTLTPAFISGLVSSLPVLLLSTTMIYPGRHLEGVFATLSPAYGAFLGAYLGLVWGQHLTLHSRGTR